MNKYLPSIFLTIFWVVFAIGACIVASLMISSKTICNNGNLNIETIEYTLCENKICNSFNLSQVSYKIYWENCNQLQEYSNLTDNDLNNMQNQYIKTNNTICYYNYLIKCNQVSYKKIPIVFPILLMIFCIFLIFAGGWLHTVVDVLPRKFNNQEPQI